MVPLGRALGERALPGSKVRSLLLGVAPVADMERYDGAYGSKDVVSTFHAAMQDFQVLRLNCA